MTGWLSDGKYHIIEDYGYGIQHQIAEEAKRLYYERYGKRNPATLSTLELDEIKTEAGKRVQERRKGRLVI